MMKKTIKKICAILSLIIVINSCLFTVSAEDDRTEYETGFIKGRFIIQTKYVWGDEAISGALTDMPPYKVCLFLSEKDKNTYFLELDNADDHGAAFEVLKHAADVLSVYLDYVFDSVPSIYAYQFAIETKYKWNDVELEPLRQLLSGHGKIMTENYESELINMYLVRSNEYLGTDELYEALKGYRELFTVKVLPPVEVAEASVVPIGDIDDDGRINSTDYLLMRSMILKTRTFRSAEMIRADLNADNKTDTTDILIMKRHLLGIKLIEVPSSFFIEQVNIICRLFGHSYKSEVVSLITHNVSNTHPKCREEIFNVHTCDRCKFTVSELISSRLIYCDK